MVAEILLGLGVMGLSVGGYLHECTLNKRLKEKYNDTQERYDDLVKKHNKAEDYVGSLRYKNRELEGKLDAEIALRETRRAILNYERTWGETHVVRIWKKRHVVCEKKWVDKGDASVRVELRNIQIEILDERIRREEAQQRKQKRYNTSTPNSINFKIHLDKLGLAPSVRDINVIKKQYKRLMMKYHPDNQVTGDVEKSKELNNAMDALEKMLS